MPPPDYTWLKWGLIITFLLVAGLLLRRHWVRHDGTFPMPTYWPRRLNWPFD